MLFLFQSFCNHRESEDTESAQDSIKEHYDNEPQARRAKAPERFNGPSSFSQSPI